MASQNPIPLIAPRSTERRMDHFRSDPFVCVPIPASSFCDICGSDGPLFRWVFDPGWCSPGSRGVPESSVSSVGCGDCHCELCHPDYPNGFPTLDSLGCCCLDHRPNVSRSFQEDGVRQTPPEPDDGQVFSRSCRCEKALRPDDPPRQIAPDSKFSVSIDADELSQRAFYFSVFSPLSGHRRDH